MPDMCAFCSLDTGGNHEAGCPVNQTAIYTQAQLDGEIQRIRAEVLASVVAYLKMAGEEAIYIQHKQAFKNAAVVVAELQPAASDLEELLREERVKEVLHFVNNAPGYSTEVMRFIDDRIAELEKARALLPKEGER